jgi:hypothetical protein
MSAILSELLTIVGIVFQTIGTILLTVQVWSKRSAFAFDTMEGGLIDKEGRWPKMIRWGLIVYLLGYIPLIIVAFINLNQAFTPKIIRASTFSLESKSGEGSGDLTLINGEPVLILNDKYSKASVQITVGAGVPMLDLSDQNGKHRVSLSAFIGAPSLEFSDEQGKIIWSAP